MIDAVAEWRDIVTLHQKGLVSLAAILETTVSRLSSDSDPSLSPAVTTILHLVNQSLLDLEEEQRASKAAVAYCEALARTLT
jgi:hypothetical protein